MKKENFVFFYYKKTLKYSKEIFALVDNIGLLIVGPRSGWNNQIIKTFISYDNLHEIVFRESNKLSVNFVNNQNKKELIIVKFHYEFSESEQECIGHLLNICSKISTIPNSSELHISEHHKENIFTNISELNQSFMEENNLKILVNEKIRDSDYEEYEFIEKSNDYIELKPEGMRGKRA